MSVRITARDVKIHDIHFQDCCNIYVNYDTKLEIKNCKFINSSVTLSRIGYINHTAEVIITNIYIVNSSINLEKYVWHHQGERFQ